MRFRLPQRKARILIVEDGITIHLFYRNVLEGPGFEVEEAVNGLEGAERAMAGSFDPLVTSRGACTTACRPAATSASAIRRA
jgi:hypothetical protein